MQPQTRRQLLKTTLPLSLLMIFGVRKLDAQTQIAEQPVCPPPPAKPTITSVINRNHGHVLLVPYEDVIQGKEKTYAIQGTSGHPHTLVIRAEEFERLRTERVLDIESSEDAGHTHAVRIERQSIEG